MTTEYLLHREVEHVLAALMPSNRLVVRVMLHTGLRVGDVLALKTADLKPRMVITEQKTGKKRLIGLPADLLADLKNHAGEVYVFQHRYDAARHRTRQSVWADVKRAEKAFRLRQNIGTHSFRKNYAVRLMQTYGDMKKVQRALNHASIETTMIYAMAESLMMAKYAKRGRKSAASSTAN